MWVSKDSIWEPTSNMCARFSASVHNMVSGDRVLWDVIECCLCRYSVRWHVSRWTSHTDRKGRHRNRECILVTGSYRYSLSLSRCVILTQQRWPSPSKTFCKSSAWSMIARRCRRICRVEWNVVSPSASHWLAIHRYPSFGRAVHSSLCVCVFRFLSWMSRPVALVSSSFIAGDRVIDVL